MKKFFSLICMLFPFFISADPRDFVAVIECMPDEDFKSMLISTADEMESAGIDGAASINRGYADGWYGSGFLYKDDDNYLLITNKHVTGGAGAFKIRFTLRDGTVIEMDENLPVFQDRYLDLALIDLPDEPFLGLEGVTLQAGGDWLTEGEDVYAAGYPLLMGEPSWQLTKGVVSNKQTAVKSIVDPEYSTLIQHTSSIDPGNSGGPLLRKIGDNWIAVGINTWSVNDRNDTYFALPFSAIDAFLKDYKELKSPDTRKDYLNRQLEENLNELVELLNSSDWERGREHWDVSWGYTEEQGWNAFLGLMKEDEDTVDTVGSRFGAQSPIQIYRESALWWTWDTYRMQIHKAESVLESRGMIHENPQEGDSLVSRINGGGKSIQVTHILFRGDWLLEDFELPYDMVEENSLDNSGLTNSTPPPKRRSGGNYFGVALSLVPGVMNNEYQDDPSLITGGGLSLFGSMELSDYSAVYMGAQFMSTKARFEYNDWDQGLITVDANIPSMEFNGGMEFFVPIEMGDVFLSPFVRGLGGMLFSFPSIDGQESEGPMFGFFYQYGGGMRLTPVEGMGFEFSLMKRQPLFQLSMNDYLPRVDDLVVSVGVLFQ